jgi:hypothetical protein
VEESAALTDGGEGQLAAGVGAAYGYAHRFAEDELSADGSRRDGGEDSTGGGGSGGKICGCGPESRKSSAASRCAARNQESRKSRGDAGRGRGGWQPAVKP